MKTKKDFSKLPKKANKNGKPEKEQRICRLVRLMLLLDSGVLNLDDAARDCNVNKRTIQRDLKVLEEAGFPIYKPVNTNGNYRLTNPFHLGKFQVTPQNADEFYKTMLSLSKFNDKAFDLLSPVQQEVYNFSKDKKSQQDKTAENAKEHYQNKTPDERHFFSLYLQGLSDTQTPAVRFEEAMSMRYVLEAAQENGEYGYKKLQLKEMQHSLAHMYRIGRDYPNALKQLQNTLKEDPKDEWAYGEMAFTYYEMGNLPAAIETLHNGIKAIGGYGETLGWYLAFLLGENHEVDKALQVFEKINPAPDEGYAFQADIYAHMGQWELALRHINKAVELNPQNKVHQFKRNYILSKTKGREQGTGTK